MSESQTVKMLVEEPFHSTIISAIRECNPGPSNPGIWRLLNLIKWTTIPEGHDSITAAIDEYFDFPGAEKWSREIQEFKDLLQQKKENAEAKRETLRRRKQEIAMILKAIRESSDLIRVTYSTHPLDGSAAQEMSGKINLLIDQLRKLV